MFCQIAALLKRITGLRSWHLAFLAMLATTPAWGATVTLAWDPSPDANVAGYRIYFGTASRSYTDAVDVGNVTQATVTVPTKGTYFFAATAYSGEGDESDYSAESQVVVGSTTTTVPPTLSAIGNISISGTASAQTVSLSGISTGSGSSVTVTASSSNPALIPDPTVIYTSPNSSGSLVLAPATNASGTATITVTVNNGLAQNNLATQTFKVTVTKVYLPPTLDPIGDVSMSGTSSVQTVTFSGITTGSGSSATVTATSSNPSLIPNPTVNYTSPSGSGSLSIKPASNTSGTATITVTVNNGQPQNSTVTQTFKVTVTKVYLPPTLNPIGGISMSGTSSVQTVTFSGITTGSGSSVTVTATSSNPSLISNPTVNYTSPGSSGSLSIKPNSNIDGTATITVTVNNGQPQNNIVTQTFTVTVTKVYLPPTLLPIGNVTISGTSSGQSVNFSGVGTGSGTSATVTATSSNPSLIPNPTVSYTSPGSSGSLMVIPASNTAGTATITVTVNNGQAQNNIVTQMFTVTVTKVYLPPTLSPISDILVYATNGAQGINFSGVTTGSGSSVTVTATSSNPNLIPDPAVNYTSPNGSGSLTIVPSPNASGSAIITVIVDNGQPQNNLASQSFTITVGNLGEAPTLSPIGNLYITQNASSKTVNLSGITTGGSSGVTVTATSSNPGLIPNPTINYTSPNATGSLSFTPVTDVTGSATITVTVNNGQPQNNLVIQSFNVTVIPLNQPPTLNPLPDMVLFYNSPVQTVALSGIGSGAINEFQALTITATSSNPGLIPNPTVNYSSPLATGELTFVPAAKGVGSAVITVTINDGTFYNNLTTRQFTVTVKSKAESIEPPSILTQPTGQVVLTGKSVSLQVVAKGSKMKYQWQCNGTNITKARGRVLNFKKATAANSGVYTVLVSNNGGAVTSLPATVVVEDEPTAKLASKPQKNGHFNFEVNGITNSKYIVEASTDLVHWTPVHTNTAPFTYVDETSDTTPCRFFRTVHVGP